MIMLNATDLNTTQPLAEGGGGGGGWCSGYRAGLQVWRLVFQTLDFAVTLLHIVFFYQGKYKYVSATYSRGSANIPWSLML